MCYYARTDFACQDWRWGNMKERCPRQPRIGETCGAKLAHTESIVRSTEVCKTCQEIQVKTRRLAKLQENIERWRAEGNRFAASKERAEREFKELEEKIDELQKRRPSVIMKNNSQRTGPGGQTGQYAGSALPPFGANPNTAYTYTSAPQAYAMSGHFGNAPSTSNNQSRSVPSYTTAPSATSANRNTVAYSRAPPRR